MLKYKGYKNMVIINPTLIFLLVLFCVPLFAFFGGQDSKMREELGLEGSQQTQGQDVEIFKRPNLEYNAYNQRDPFEDLLAQKKQELEKKTEAEIGAPEEPPPLTVKGLIWGGSLPQAIINDKVVKIGDVIEEAEIINIGKDGVIVLYKKRIYKLSSPASNYMNTGGKGVIK